jgi:mRNA-degrading endonuclease RelE of RelBE toxin-antitoxin system
MNLQLSRKFVRDANKLPDSVSKLLRRILVEVRSAKSLYEINHCSKLRGKADFFRIRMGIYRITFTFDGTNIVMKRVLLRGRIYKK